MLLGYSSRTAADYVILYHANNTQTVEQVYTVSGGAVVASPVSLGSSTDKAFLFIFGTGLQDAGTAGVTVTISGISVPVSYAGPQGGFVSGVGKSGVLRRLAEQISLEAQVILLSPSRTIRGGWLHLRSALGCTVSARDFLSDLASDGGAVLFIDGVDIFDDDEKKRPSATSCAQLRRFRISQLS